MRTVRKSDFSLVAVPAGALDEIADVEIKLAFEAIVGHRMIRQFAGSFPENGGVYVLHCTTIYTTAGVK